MIKFVIASSVALAIVTPAVAQNSRDQYRGNQNGGSTFDSIDPLRTDPAAPAAAIPPILMVDAQALLTERAVENAAPSTLAPTIRLRLLRRREKVVDNSVSSIG